MSWQRVTPAAAAEGRSKMPGWDEVVNQRLHGAARRVMDVATCEASRA